LQSRLGLLGILGRYVAPLEVVLDLSPQFVVLVSHTQRKLIQSNIALMLFCISRNFS
jgi:hypothetical protein